MPATAPARAAVAEPRILRIRLGLTQRELAVKLGVSLRTVSRWDGGITRPHRVYVWRMQKMLEAFHAEAEE